MEVARFWRTTGQRYQMIGEVCENCGNKEFPPRDVCEVCAREKNDAKKRRVDLVEVEKKVPELVLVK